MPLARRTNTMILMAIPAMTGRLMLGEEGAEISGAVMLLGSRRLFPHVSICN